MFTTLLTYWRPAIEIFLIFLVVYPILKYIHGTRGEGVLKGLVIFVALAFGITYYFVSEFNLPTIKYILDQMPGILLMGMIVIFQPEIRRGLIRLSRNPLLRFFDASRSTLENEVIVAVERLSREKTGALIAFEREVGLRHVSETGVRIDALLTNRLIVSIFHKNGPLHDGGVVIRGDRLLAAAAVFPLSENVNKIGNLGTRHQAGLGLSEESDALIIIVSEETGQISVARGGIIYRDLKPADLKRFLADAYLVNFRTGDDAA